MPEIDIEGTKKSLGKVIKKPPLTEKLLSKPPYRYLYDIIIEVNRVTNFFNGLFTEDELKSPSKETPKDIKLTFLQKAIDVVGLVAGKKLSARPSKIIAGHDADKTNEFLQVLGNLIQAKKESKAAIKKVLSGTTNETEKREKSGKEDKSKRRRSSKNDIKGNDEEHESRERSSAKQRPPPSELPPKPPSSPPPPVPKTIEENSHPPIEMKPDDIEDSHDAHHSPLSDEKPPEEPDATPKRPASAKGNRRRTVHKGKSVSPPNPPAQERPVHISSSSDSDDPNDNVVSSPTPEQRVAAAPPPTQPNVMTFPDVSMPRPASARPAAPRKRGTQQQQVEKPVVVTNSASNSTKIIYDKGDDSSSDDDAVVVTQDTLIGQGYNENGQDTIAVDESEQHGSLVRDILQNRKKEDESKHSNKLDKSLSLQSVKEREHEARKVKELQQKIQDLVKGATPLKHIMNYVQEDIDAMRKELGSWRQEITNNSLKLADEARKTEEELGPLHSTLENLNRQLLEGRELIQTKKSVIIQNEIAIQKMLNRMQSQTK